ncbi:MAG: M23 family metallopeptidase [Deltaproteobacteria bacterium]|nr:M23 family metallopeptidase [Deltaproteobacteria bacterium]
MLRSLCIATLLGTGCAALAPTNEKMEWPSSKLKEVTPIVLQECETLHLENEKAEPLAAPPVALAHAGLRWPVMARAMTSPFGIRNDPLKPRYVRFHRGIDLSATLGSPVHAALSGRVVQEGWGGGHGQRVTIDHGNGVLSSYSHLSIALVSEGMLVPEGQAIGLVGDTGRTTGPHLHFEVTIDGEPTDPLPLLGGRLPTDAEYAPHAMPPKLPLQASLSAR